MSDAHMFAWDVITKQHGIMGVVFGAIIFCLGFYLRFRIHTDKNTIDVAKIIKQLMEADRIEYRARIQSLEDANKRQYKELQDIWDQHNKSVLKCAIEMKDMERRILILQDDLKDLKSD